jgi:hypothetical protein
VDLNQAFRDSRERILIQPGDFIVLQERPGEALTRYFTQSFRFTTFVPEIARGSGLTTGLTVSSP